MEPQPVASPSQETLESSPGGGTHPGFVEQLITGAQATPSAGSLLVRFLTEPSDEMAIALWLSIGTARRGPGAADMLQQMERDIAAIDGRIGEQIDAVLHHEVFQALEASWRRAGGPHQSRPAEDQRQSQGLERLVREVVRDLERAIEFDQTPCSARCIPRNSIHPVASRSA